MLEVLIPSNSEFNKYENEIMALYKENQGKITDTNSFEFIRDNTLFYLFLIDKEVLGAIYYFIEDGKLFLNGFAKRNSLFEKLYCLLWSTTWFNTDIYAEAQNRASAFCLLKCGFKRVKGNLFIFKKR